MGARQMIQYQFANQLEVTHTQKSVTHFDSNDASCCVLPVAEGEDMPLIEFSESKRKSSLGLFTASLRLPMHFDVFRWTPSLCEDNLIPPTFSLKSRPSDPPLQPPV